MSVIRVESVSKRYVLGHQRDARDGLRHRLEHAIRNPFKWLSHRKQQLTATREEFWALKDVSFDIKQGDVVGVIGRNGAGKSTLLKILSRITEPTSGRIEIDGRVASLLEVGTGFHPELTGRENIFLNGAILGMSRAEIKRKFDEIVAFSEIEKFLDTPVKRYSSGMYVRLAFAVAAHLEPEILIVDEVLAVGDAEFQKKCLGKMEAVSTKEGRTVIFVSHNVNAVESLCRRVLLFEKGKIRADTEDVRQAISSYLGPNLDAKSEWSNPGGALTNPWFYPTKFFLGDVHGNLVSMPARNDAPLYICIEGHVEKENLGLSVGYGIFDESGALLYWSATTDMPESQWPRLKSGAHRIRSQLPKRLLNQGEYKVELLIAIYQREWISCPGSSAPALRLSIQGGLSDSPYWMERRPGLLAPVYDWTSEVKVNGNGIQHSPSCEKVDVT